MVRNPAAQFFCKVNAIVKFRSIATARHMEVPVMILYCHKRPQQPGKALAPIKLTGVEDVNGFSSGFWDTGKQGFIIPAANHNNFFGRDDTAALVDVTDAIKGNVSPRPL
jgi:hypothetical protein